MAIKPAEWMALATAAMLGAALIEDSYVNGLSKSSAKMSAGAAVSAIIDQTRGVEQHSAKRASSRMNISFLDEREGTDIAAAVELITSSGVMRRPGTAERSYKSAKRKAFLDQ